MFQNEQDVHNTNGKKFQPFLFISCTIIVLAVFLVAICLIAKPHRIIHTFSHLKLQVSRISLQKAQQPPWKTFLVKPGDNLLKIFNRANVDNDTYYQITKIKDAQPFLINLRPKQAFYLLFDSQQQLDKLIFRIDKLKYLQIVKQKNNWQTELITLPLEKKLETVDGYIQQTFHQATDQYNVPRKIATNFADTFSSHIDFAKQIHPKDEFKIIYEEYYDGKRKIKPGNIIAAELINRRKPFYAIRYNDSHNVTGYYTPKGKNWHLAFMRAPLHYKRISSPFGARRMHPILHIVRAHEGVDLAAPRGTPIKASGNGRIVYRGRKGGYGEAIIIRHNRKYTTLYAHLSRFAPRLHVGSRVREGQLIGYVGMTGLATGPHLHYEFRIFGIPHDPMRVKLPAALPIARKERETYLAYAQEMVKQLNHLKLQR